MDCEYLVRVPMNVFTQELDPSTYGFEIWASALVPVGVEESKFAEREIRVVLVRLIRTRTTLRVADR